MKPTSLIVASLCFSLCAHADLSDGLLLHASFDQGAKADTAKGKADATVTGQLRQTDGVRGKALLAGDSAATSVAYENEGNFPVAQGTLSFWLKPVDWLGNRGKAQLFNLFVQGGGSNQGYFGLEMERFNQPEPVLMFYSLYFSNRDKMIISYGGSKEWANGLWHHVALTWDDRQVKLYVDGALAGSAQLTAPFQASDLHSKTFVIGGTGEEHTALDDLRLWNRPLSLEEIAELVKKDGPGGK